MAAIDDHPKAEYRQTALRRRRQELPFGRGVFEVMNVEDSWLGRKNSDEEL